MVNEPLTKDKIAFLYLTEEEQKMETHDALLQIVLGLQSCKTKEGVVELLQDVRALQQRIEYAKVASAVRLLREKIGEKRKEQAMILQELEQEIKVCEECDAVRCINHEQRTGQWYGVNHTISELEEWISEVFAGVGK